jgi:hypothetical protein
MNFSAAGGEDRMMATFIYGFFSGMFVPMIIISAIKNEFFVSGVFIIMFMLTSLCGIESIFKKRNGGEE